MSRIIKGQQDGEPDPERPEEASDRFLPLADLWRETGVAGSSLQEQKVQWKRRQEELFDQARQEAERIRKQAREEGYAQGKQEGRLAGQEKYEQAVRRMEAVLASLDREIRARNERYEEELLLLIKAMVDRLVHHEVSVNRKVIQACLREALQYVAENSRIKVHLHAHDFQLLREAGLEDPSLLEGKNHLQLVEDPAVAAGGCFLETDFGEVDASLDKGRQKLFEAIDSIFRNLTDREVPGR